MNKHTVVVFIPARTPKRGVRVDLDRNAVGVEKIVLTAYTFTDNAGAPQSAVLLAIDQAPSNVVTAGLVGAPVPVIRRDLTTGGQVFATPLLIGVPSTGVLSDLRVSLTNIDGTLVNADFYLWLEYHTRSSPWDLGYIQDQDTYQLHGQATGLNTWRVDYNPTLEEQAEAMQRNQNRFSKN